MVEEWPDMMRALPESHWKDIRERGIHVEVDRKSGSVVLVSADGKEVAYGRTVYLAYRKLTGGS